MISIENVLDINDIKLFLLAKAQSLNANNYLNFNWKVY